MMDRFVLFPGVAEREREGDDGQESAPQANPRANGAFQLPGFTVVLARYLPCIKGASRQAGMRFLLKWCVIKQVVSAADVPPPSTYRSSSAFHFLMIRALFFEDQSKSMGYRMVDTSEGIPAALAKPGCSTPFTAYMPALCA